THISVFYLFISTAPATTPIYTLSLHDALPIYTLYDQLLELEKQPNEKSIIEEIFRVAHTLKGMSATMGFDDLAQLTHKLENVFRSEEHTSELQSRFDLVCRLLLETKNNSK